MSRYHSNEGTVELVAGHPSHGLTVYCGAGVWWGDCVCGEWKSSSYEAAMGVQLAHGRHLLETAAGAAQPEETQQRG